MEEEIRLDVYCDHVIIRPAPKFSSWFTISQLRQPIENVSRGQTFEALNWLWNSDRARCASSSPWSNCNINQTALDCWFFCTYNGKYHVGSRGVCICSKQQTSIAQRNHRHTFWLIFTATKSEKWVNCNEQRALNELTNDLLHSSLCRPISISVCVSFSLLSLLVGCFVG